MILLIRVTATSQSWRINARNVSTIESVEANVTNVRMLDGTSVQIPVAVGTITTDIETAAAATTLTSVTY